MSRAIRVAVALLGGVVLLGASALTVARLIGGDSRQLAWVQAFTPWATPAHLLALVLAAALLVLPGARPRRRVLVPAAVTAAVGLVLHVTWLAPLFAGGGEHPAPGAEPVTAMTANLRFGGADAAAVVATAEDQGVDLLVVQEVTEQALAGLEAAGVGDAFGYRAGRALAGASGTMAFSRAPIGEVTPIATEMDSFSFRTSGLDVVAVHPAYPLDARWAPELALLRDSVEEARPDLVLGDFNASLDHEPLRDILATGLRDAAEQAGAGWQPTWPADGGFRGLPLPPAVAIDHVLVGSGLAALRTSTVEIGGTDHLALVAEVIATR